MEQAEILDRILQLEEKISRKQTSVFSAHTLVPVSLVISVVVAAVGFGIMFQKIETANQQYQDLRTEIKELKSDINSLKDILLKK